MNRIDDPRFARNFGFWGEEEQQAIFDTRVAIAGVGGDGFQLGLRLVRLGIQYFSVADPEVFEPENTNRVPGSTSSTYGRNKAEVFKEKVIDINPNAKVNIFTEGVQSHNIVEFMKGASLVLDESELTRPDIGTMIARQARKQGIPNILVMNVGFAGIATSFHPNRGKTFEWMMGIPEGVPIDEIRWLPAEESAQTDTTREPRKINFDRCLPYLPYKYGDINSLIAIQNGAPLPSIAPGVDIAAGIGEAEVLKHIFASLGKKGWPKPVWAPHFRYMDAMQGVAGETRFPKFSYIRHVSRVVIRSKLKINPVASYTDIERSRRNESFKKKLN